MEVAGKPGSVVFSAYRDDDHTYSEDNFVTFSGCHVNIGNAFRSGVSFHDNEMYNIFVCQSADWDVPVLRGRDILCHVDCVNLPGQALPAQHQEKWQDSRLLEGLPSRERRPEHGEPELPPGAGGHRPAPGHSRGQHWHSRKYLCHSPTSYKLTLFCPPLI